MGDSSAPKWAVAGAILAATLGMAWLVARQAGNLIGVTYAVRESTFCERLIYSPATYLGIAALVITAAAAWQSFTGSITVGRLAIDREHSPSGYWALISLELVGAAALVRFAVALAVA